MSYAETLKVALILKALSQIVADDILKCFFFFNMFSETVRLGI